MMKFKIMIMKEIYISSTKFDDKTNCKKSKIYK